MHEARFLPISINLEVVPFVKALGNSIWKPAILNSLNSFLVYLAVIRPPSKYLPPYGDLFITW